MDGTYEFIKKKGKNTVDHLIKWMQDADLVAKGKTAEDKVRHMFDRVENKDNVSLDTFMQIVELVAADLNIPLEDFSKQLVKMAPKFLTPVTDGASSAHPSVSGSVRAPMK